MSDLPQLAAEQLLLPEQLAEIVRDNAQDAVMLRTFPVVADTADWKSATQIQKLLAHIESQARRIVELEHENHELVDVNIDLQRERDSRRAAAEPVAELFIGIEHDAICIRDATQWLRFYAKLEQLPHGAQMLIVDAGPRDSSPSTKLSAQGEK